MAPLTEHDAILGMPFLTAENIVVDPAQNKVILPDMKDPTVQSELGDVGLNDCNL